MNELARSYYKKPSTPYRTCDVRNFTLTTLIKVPESPATTDGFLERDTFQPGRLLDPIPLGTFHELQFFPFHPFVLTDQHLSYD